MAERLIHIRFWFLAPEYQLATLPGAKPEVTGFVNPPAREVDMASIDNLLK